ncbi:hypothetical protein HPB50_018534 [Hyalomma asiaticum]|uniref:Uncharacterized protein n=1 Tax=Hyalomma asiaticum TaxID=266040 RepID=A0ACB7TR87_HYAAI|nr:hypothetical protein HPB50_018534 [Hyalomma asiaticum]
MNQTNLPVSEIIKSKEVDEPKKQSREDWRKAKELEEARKAGTAPAAVDEEGKDINPHIPQYISSAPWYFGAKGPTLKHQRPQPEKQKQFSRISEYYSRGEFVSETILNESSSTELTRKSPSFCIRPRKIGARFTNDDIAPDEKDLPSLNLDYDGKRDRWNGFDPACYQAVIEEYRKVEEAKRQLKEDKLKHDIMNLEGVSTRERDDSEEEADGDEDKYADNADMPGTKVDSKQRITVRNLRIREDVAKYLRNLDPNSAYYDPKTRSMRDNPYKNSNKTPEELHFAGDNFVRYSGDTQKIAEAQLFAWQAYEKGVDVHLQAEPTKAELLNKEFLSKEEEFRHSMKDSILEKYGGAEHLQVPPKELIFAQTEDYVEYSRHGEVVRGAEKPVIRSKYEEHVLINNHTSVWGSYWKDFQWGYKCCHSLIKNSYCTGASGKEVQAMAGGAMLMPAKLMGAPTVNTDASQDEKVEEEINEKIDEVVEKVKSPKEESIQPSSEEQQNEALPAASITVIKSPEKVKTKKKKKKSRKAKKHKRAKSSSSSSSDSEDSDAKAERERKEKIKKAMEQIDKDKTQETDERKRKYNSMYDVKAPTEEEMEAYYMKRMRDDDPMASFMS